MSVSAGDPPIYWPGLRNNISPHVMPWNHSWNHSKQSDWQQQYEGRFDYQPARFDQEWQNDPPFPSYDEPRITPDPPRYGDPVYFDNTYNVISITITVFYDDVNLEEEERVPWSKEGF